MGAGSYAEPVPTPLTTSEDNWRHRGMTMKCVTCMFFVLKLTERGDISPSIGRCRRRAPGMAGWPAVFTSDWCGDHKIDEQKL